MNKYSNLSIEDLIEKFEGNVETIQLAEQGMAASDYDPEIVAKLSSRIADWELVVAEIKAEIVKRSNEEFAEVIEAINEAIELEIEMAEDDDEEPNVKHLEDLIAEIKANRKA